MENYLDEIMLRFFRDDLGGILITDEDGAVIYEDEKSSAVRNSHTNWSAACPPPDELQKAELWDLVNKDTRATCLVATSTVKAGDKMLQIHHIMDNSEYTELFHEINGYSKSLLYEKEHDKLTGLYNKGKFMTMQTSLFPEQDSVAIYYMDVNNLKYVNDTFGHDVGDRMICKAASSLKKITARNVLAFRMGGDEFAVVAMHISEDEAEALRKRWENVLAELNSLQDGIVCVVSCGMVYARRPYDVAELIKRADQRMYEDKKEKKRTAAMNGETIARPFANDE